MKNLAGWAGLFIALTTCFGILYNVWGQVATKEYHESDLKPMVKSLEAIEANTTVERIRGLLRSRCRGNFPPELQNILDERLIRYQQLTGREFRTGECRNGVWFNASGVPG